MRGLYLCVCFLLSPLVSPVWPEDAAPADDGVAVLVEVLAESDDPAFQLDILKGINAALEGRRRLQAPPGWAAVREKLLSSDNADVRAQAQALAVIFGDVAALKAMHKTLIDAKAPAAERQKALQSLLAANDPALAKTLQLLVCDPPLRTHALAGLAAYDDPATPKVVLEQYDSFDIPARNAAISTLAGRLEYARELVSAVNAGRIPRRDLTAATVRQLRDLGDAEIDAFVDQHWGVARQSSEEKTREIAHWKEILTETRIKAADPSRGRALFARTCAQCHTLYGEGGKVGPDLTGSNRANLDYVLMNVIDPSAVISKDFQMTLIRTKAGRVVSGLASEGEHAVKVVSETGTVLVPRDEIDRQKLSDLSMMPEGLLAQFKEDEVADLIAYLRTTAQTPLP